MGGSGADGELARAGGATVPPFGRFNQFQVDFAEGVALVHPRAGEMNTAKIARRALPVLAEARRLARIGEPDVLLATMRWAKGDARVIEHLRTLTQSELSFMFGMVELAAHHWRGGSSGVESRPGER
jgi:hypothetical protein